MSRAGIKWTSNETTLALRLYLEITYTNISPNNPKVIQLAKFLQRSPKAVSAKLWNLAANDPTLSHLNRKFLSNGSSIDRTIWSVFSRDDVLDHDYVNDVAASIDHGELDAFAPQVLPKAPSPANLETEITIQTTIRISQYIFRIAVRHNCHDRCVLSRCTAERLIEAAHILPWSAFPELRLDVTNGLVLNRLIHSAFDSNILGIDANGMVHISEFLLKKSGTLSNYFSSLSGYKLDFSNKRLFRVAPNRDFLDQRFELYKKAQRNSK